MPEWSFHSKSFLYWRRRLRLNRDPQEVLTGLLPTSQVDRSWPKDVRDVWGVRHQQNCVAQFNAIELVAQRRPLRVYRVEAILRNALGFTIAGTSVHLFTPVQNYDPTVNNTTIGFPWLASGYAPGMAAYLADAFVLGGSNAAIQVVTVNLVPFNAIGPEQFFGGTTGGGATNHVGNVVFWEFQDPPFYVQPFTSLCVQTIAALANYFLTVNFFYSEDEAE